MQLLAARPKCDRTWNGAATSVSCLHTGTRKQLGTPSGPSAKIHCSLGTRVPHLGCQKSTHSSDDGTDDLPPGCRPGGHKFAGKDLILAVTAYNPQISSRGKSCRPACAVS